MSQSEDKTIPPALRARAERLGLRILVESCGDEKLDCGPFLLVGEEGYHVWEGGLPLEGIIDALDCYERELGAADDDARMAAWRDFGAGWRDKYPA